MTEDISACELFYNIDIESIQNLFNGVFHQVKKFSPGDLIAISETDCNHLLIISQGKVKGEMLDSTGKTVKIEDITAPNTIASAFLFGKQNKFPVNVVAVEETTVVVIPKEELVKMFQKNAIFLTNFLNVISNRTQFLTKKFKLHQFKSLKAKIAKYLLDRSTDIKPTITLTSTQQQLAELFGVTRPSFARTIRELNEESIIESKAKTIRILNRKRLITLQNE